MNTHIADCHSSRLGIAGRPANSNANRRGLARCLILSSAKKKPRESYETPKVLSAAIKLIAGPSGPHQHSQCELL